MARPLLEVAPILHLNWVGQLVVLCREAAELKRSSPLQRLRRKRASFCSSTVTTRSPARAGLPRLSVDTVILSGYSTAYTSDTHSGNCRYYLQSESVVSLLSPVIRCVLRFLSQWQSYSRRCQLLGETKKRPDAIHQCACQTSRAQPGAVGCHVSYRANCKFALVLPATGALTTRRSSRYGASKPTCPYKKSLPASLFLPIWKTHYPRRYLNFSTLSDQACGGAQRAISTCAT